MCRWLHGEVHGEVCREVCVEVHESVHRDVCKEVCGGVHGEVCRCSEKCMEGCAERCTEGVYGEVHIGLLGWLQGGVVISAISNSFEILNALTTIQFLQQAVNDSKTKCL